MFTSLQLIAPCVSV